MTASPEDLRDLAAELFVAATELEAKLGDHDDPAVVRRREAGELVRSAAERIEELEAIVVDLERQVFEALYGEPDHSAGTWRPIATVPLDGRRVLIWQGREAIIATYVPAISSRSPAYWRTVPGAWPRYAPSHWAPLPDAPDGEAVGPSSTAVADAVPGTSPNPPAKPESV